MPRSAPIPESGWSDSAITFYRNVLANYSLNVAEKSLLVQISRNITRLDALYAASVDAPLVITTATGGQAVNPILVEQRLQAGVLAKLVASLRLPDEVAPPKGATDPEAPTRPQHRNAARGTYTGKSYAPTDRPELRSVT